MSQLTLNGFDAYTDGSSWGQGNRAYPVGCWTRYSYTGGKYILWDYTRTTASTNAVTFSVISVNMDGGFIRVQ